MRETLETDIITIEYNKSTKKKAFKTKRLIDSNPEFFKVFLNNETKISYLNPHAGIFLNKNETILDYLSLKIPVDIKVRFTKKNWLESHTAKGILWLLIQNKETNTKEVIPRDYIDTVLAFAYFKEQKDYLSLKEYLERKDKKTTSKIEKWLNQKYRYDLLNLLIELQTYSLKERVLNIHSLEELKDTVKNILKFLVGEEYLLMDDEVKTPKEITFPMHQDQINNLCKEFLIEIDPSLDWYQKFIDASTNQTFIYNQTDLKLAFLNPQQKDKFQLFEHPDGNWYINFPSNNTIEDSIIMIHEFIHYIIETSCKKPNQIPFQYDEILTIYFETLMGEFLIKKGYPKEEITKYYYNRILDSVNYSEVLLPILLFIDTYLQEGQITEQGEIKKQKAYEKTYQQLFPDLNKTSLDNESLQELVEETCDDWNINLIVTPDIIEKTYPYIIGRKYSELLIEKTKKDPTVINDMINLTNDFKTLTKEEIDKRLGITNSVEIEKQVSKTKKLV